MGRRKHKKPSLTDVKAHPPDDMNDKLNLLKLFVDRLTGMTRKTGAQWNKYSFNRKSKHDDGTYVMDNGELIAIYNAGISSFTTVDKLLEHTLEIKGQITDADRFLSPSQRKQLNELGKHIMLQEYNMRTLNNMYENADENHFATYTVIYADSNVVEHMS